MVRNSLYTYLCWLGVLILCCAIGFSQGQAGEEVTFRYVPSADLEVNTLTLRGSFNNWGQTPMAEQADGSWVVVLELPEGEHAYKFFINAQWPQDMQSWRGYGPVDPEADGYVDDGYDGQNALRVVEVAPLELTAEDTDEKRQTLLRRTEHHPTDPAYLSLMGDYFVMRLRVSRDTFAEIEINLISEEGKLSTVAMHKQLWWGQREVWRAVLPSVSPVSYQFVFSPLEETGVTSFTYPEQPYTTRDHIPFPPVPWVGEQVFYQIFPDRFFNADPSNDALALASDEATFNTFAPPFGGPPTLAQWTDPPGPSHCCHQYFGGDLQGIIQKLDDLQELGVTALYLNPIFDAGSAHGYDTHDYYRIAPHLGTAEEFEALLEHAHQRDIRVILDYVPNHTGIGFWAFQDIIEHGRDSAYWDWYQIAKWPFEAGEPDAYMAWWGHPSLPQLNMRNPEVRDYITKVAEHWLALGIDGWRVDVPADVVDGEAFFSAWRKQLKAAYPHAYLIGEIWQQSPEWVQGEAFDSLMTYALGKDILMPFAKGQGLSGSGTRALASLSRYMASYGEQVLGMGFNVISSHDTDRLLSSVSGAAWQEEASAEAVERLKLLASLQYSMPGAPVVFQGDECGFLGKKAREGTQDLHRYPLQWDQCDEALKGHYRELAALRQSLTGLRSSVYRNYSANRNILGFYRGEGVAEVFILANSSTEDHAFTLPEGLWLLQHGAGVACHPTCEAITGDLIVPGLGVLYLTPISE